MPLVTDRRLADDVLRIGIGLARHRRTIGRARAGWRPEPHQTPPPGDWDVWILRGGRGSGKTGAGVNAVLEHLREFGPRARVGVGAPTIADARDTCAEGDSGLITTAPDEFRRGSIDLYNRSLGEARHIAGGYVKFLGSVDPGRWNGPQWTMLWADELALWNEESWDQAQFGLRLGPHPRAVVTTTPKARKFVHDLELQPGTVLTTATTYDNPHLAPRVKERLERKYGGTRLGRQELLGEYLDDVPGALWSRGQLDRLRVRSAPDMGRIVVAVDPALTSGEDADETGILVCGKGVDGQGYVLADLSCRLSPDGWATRAVNAYREFKADRIVAETNNGGDLVERTIRTVDRHASYTGVHASRGKRIRAEPIAALYEQSKIHHVGTFVELEDQQCNFTPDGFDGSPDRLDALVWGLTELFEGASRKVVAW